MTENKSITQKIDELTKSTDWFYSDDFKLEEATRKYREAVQLAKEIEKDLDELKNEITVLAEDFHNFAP